MRAALAALAAAGSILVLGGCATDIADGVDEARGSAASIGAGVRSSAASVGAGTRRTCAAAKAPMAALDSLAGRLVEHPELRTQLAPQVRTTLDQLSRAIGDRGELQPVVAAGKDLAQALGGANESAIELSGRQAQLAVRSGQAVCKLAG
jgi:hypothetical protein